MGLPTALGIMVSVPVRLWGELLDSAAQRFSVDVDAPSTIDPARRGVAQQERFADLRVRVRQGQELGRAVVAQRAVVDHHRRGPAHRHAAAAVAAAHQPGERNVSGAVAQIDAVQLKALHGKIGDQHVVDVEQRDPRLPLGARQIVFVRQLVLFAQK